MENSKRSSGGRIQEDKESTPASGEILKVEYLRRIADALERIAWVMEDWRGDKNS